jgi:hypothetical protein
MTTQSRARLPICLLMSPLVLGSCGNAGTGSQGAAGGEPALALHATWKVLEDKSGSFSVVGKVKYEPTQATTIVECQKSGETPVVLSVTSKAKYTATTYQILEKKEATKSMAGETCRAAWDSQVGETIRWKVENGVLTLTGEDGSTNTLALDETR